MHRVNWFLIKKKVLEDIGGIRKLCGKNGAIGRLFGGLFRYLAKLEC